MAEDNFIVSIAPYENETHPCTFYNLTGCQGEMVKQPFHLTNESDDGVKIIDEQIETAENGFNDLLLPRNENFKVTINYKNKQVQDEISTFNEDSTCITTMQLI